VSYLLSEEARAQAAVGAARRMKRAGLADSMEPVTGKALFRQQLVGAEPLAAGVPGVASLGHNAPNNAWQQNQR
jgi:hypothetical protein